MEAMAKTVDATKATDVTLVKVVSDQVVVIIIATSLVESGE